MDGFLVTVSELPAATTEEDLQELFSPYGKVDITFPPSSGNESRTAKVLLKNEETAVQAVKELRGKSVRGVEFRIDIDRKKERGRPDPQPTPAPTPRSNS